jgi:membrane protein implicated in regulation of membrane protease activity
MIKRGWSSKVVLRYTLIQIPGIILLILVFIFAQTWIKIPLWLISLVVLIWIVKDFILFFFVWPAYDWKRTGARNSIIGKTGIVTEAVNPYGYVNIEGELWYAEVEVNKRAAKVGDTIRVMGVKDLKLLVEAIDLDI